MRRAFTLIELLVVVSIIALLIAILLPALSRARESAKETQCAADQRSLGMASVAYAIDNKSLLPGIAQVIVVVRRGTCDAVGLSKNVTNPREPASIDGLFDSAITIQSARGCSDPNGRNDRGVRNGGDQGEGECGQNGVLQFHDGALLSEGTCGWEFGSVVLTTYVAVASCQNVDT